MKRDLICAVLIVVFSISTTVVSGQDGWGHLSGQIILKGDAPENAPEDVAGNPDRELCLVDGKVPLDDGIVVSDKNELRDVFVLMYTGRGASQPDSFHPSYEKMKETKLVLDNVKCRFVPKALFVRSGQKLILKNSDNTGHNCHITTFGHEYNPNIPANKEVEIVLGEESDKVPGEVKCDIHKWMDSVILIRDNPYVAITDANGKFKIENIPAGDWKFQFWHKKGGYLKQIEIEGFDVSRRGVIELSIKDGETLELGELNLPAKALEK